MNNQLLAMMIRERGLLDQLQGVGLMDYQGNQSVPQNELMAQLLANWNPLNRPVYQPQPIGYPQPTSGVRG